MDLTALFKASVKTVRLRNKSITEKSRILKHKVRDEFSIKANDIRYQIIQLRDLLIENRAAYMRFGIHLKSSTQMTDEERNIIDKESEKIVLLCINYLNDLKSECIKNQVCVTFQVVEHQLAIIDILSGFLKGIFRIHNQQKEKRIQHELETYKLLKLESNISVVCHQNNHQISKYQPQFARIMRSQQSNIDLNKDACLRNNKIKTYNVGQSEITMDEDQADKLAISYSNMSSDDIQVLESENIQLLNDIKGLSDEVEQIEKNVVGIAKLQEIFTEKVMNIFSLYHCVPAKFSIFMSIYFKIFKIG